MLKTKDLIKDVEEKYVPMLKEVDTVEFAKCISIWSGLSLDCLDDKTLIGYLHTWAKNKYRFYELFGNKLTYDFNIQLKKNEGTIRNELRDLKKTNPVYGLWLDNLQNYDRNVIDKHSINWMVMNNIEDWFPNIKIDGMTITHFLKSYLNAPDNFITKLAGIYENNMMEATYTLSIDPIDILTASENPYSWHSCYSIKNAGDNSSHADGCVAAMLDKVTVMALVWKDSGKLTLDNYTFKNIKYKIMRQFIDFSPNYKQIYFHLLYPSDDRSSDYEEYLRLVVEKFIAEKLNMKDKWVQRGSSSSYVYRENMYGYNEFDRGELCANIDLFDEKTEESAGRKIKEEYAGSGDIKIEVYTEEIYCPCGCGTILHGSDDEDESVDDNGNRLTYVGDGFNCSNFVRRHWCEYMDDWCDDWCEGACCMDCPTYADAHPLCPITDEECPDGECAEVYDGYVNSTSQCDHCHCLDRLLDELKENRGDADADKIDISDYDETALKNLRYTIWSNDENVAEYSVESIRKMFKDMNCLAIGRLVDGLREEGEI